MRRTSTTRIQIRTSTRWSSRFGCSTAFTRTASAFGSWCSQHRLEESRQDAIKRFQNNPFGELEPIAFHRQEYHTMRWCCFRIEVNRRFRVDLFAIFQFSPNSNRIQRGPSFTEGGSIGIRNDWMRRSRVGNGQTIHQMRCRRSIGRKDGRNVTQVIECNVMRKAY